jgi:hypothetical protein
MRSSLFGLIALVLAIAIYSTVAQISSAVPLSASAGATTQPTNDVLAWHNIPFQLGQKQFQNGDRVQITAVRCTAEQLQMGELMQVKGTYDLNSADEADLCLFMTATDGNGKGPIYPQQTMSVKRGHGEFVLREPITCRGWPHVSFYDKKSGENIGGVYFGYGEWLQADGGKGEDRIRN